MNLHDAIVQSCDVYFYEVARRVGIDRIAEMAKRLGVGVELGVELPSERRGLVPTRAWKKKALGKSWTIGETLIAGIRSEEHTSELQSLMRISYAVFCLQKKKKVNN